MRMFILRGLAILGLLLLSSPLMAATSGCYGSTCLECVIHMDYTTGQNWKQCETVQWWGSCYCSMSVYQRQPWCHASGTCYYTPNGPIAPTRSSSRF